MEPKEILRRYRYAQEKADRLHEEYKTEKEKIDAIRTALSGDGMPHAPGISHPTEDEAVRLAVKLTEWESAEIDALQVRQIVFDLVKDIKGVEGTILYERYINLRHWREIAEIVNLGEPGLFKAHARAVDLFSEILRKKYSKV